jgi:hypothetical protein
MIIQTYALSVLQQGKVNLSSTPGLSTYEKEINGTLATAQVHAQTYLNVILPSLIGNINNISGYYDLHAAVASTLPVDATEEAWVAALGQLKIATTTYSSATANTVTSLQALQTDFETDLKGFQTITSNLNTAVNGDNGLLEQEDAQLKSIQTNINGAIAGIVTSGLGIAGGVFMIIVGTVADFVTAGTSTEIALAGIGILSTAVAGEVASAVTLASLNDEKGAILRSQAQLKAEVSMALGISSGYNSLVSSCQEAISASQEMQGAWDSLHGNLDNILKDLNQGIISTGQVRKIFLDTVNSELKDLQAKIGVIKGQLAGVRVTVSSADKTVGQTIIEVAHPKSSFARASHLRLTSTSENPLDSGAKNIADANKDQVGGALLIQTYANSVLQQPNVDFGGEKHLVQYEKSINAGLATGRQHATNYLNVVQPSIIKNLTSISGYYDLFTAIPTVLPPGSTEEQWVQTLTALKTQSDQNHAAATSVVTQLNTLRDDLSQDAQFFKQTTSDLNAAVDGDNGVLSGLDDEISSIQSSIDGAIAGIVVSGLAIVGGAFLTAVGGITDFVTAGASTPLVVAGVAVVAAGIGGEVASAITLKNLNDQKANLINEKAQLKAEVKLAQGISSGFGSLSDQLSGAITAAQSMANAWNLLGNDINTITNDLQNGIQNADTLRQLWLTAANTTVAKVQTDISIIKQQLAGVHTFVSPPGQTVGDTIVQAAQNPPMRTAFARLSIATPRVAANSSGTLSRAQANVVASLQHVQSITGLPSDAARVQQNVITSTTLMLSQTDGMKTVVATYTQTSQAQINSWLAKISANDVAGLADFLASLKSSTDKVQASVQGTFQQVSATREGIDEAKRQNTQIISNYESQISGLRSSLEGAKNEADSLQRKYQYLLLLGFLGLPGLAAALAAYELGMQKVNELENEAASAQNQIDALTRFLDSVQSEQQSLDPLVATVSGLANAVSIVSGDVSNMNADSANLPILAVQLNALLLHLTTLANDAS